MKIICIGKNYQKHADEMKSEVPSEPMFFMKPETSLVEEGNQIPYPDFTEDLHYELELAVRVGKTLKNIPAESAHAGLDGWGLGIDFTARDIQSKLKKKGYPWEKSKGFDGSAYISSKFFKPGEIEHSDIISFRLLKNGETVQTASSNEMIFSIPELIEHVSRFITLHPGDLLFSGTPEGVGPVHPGDELVGFLEDNRILECEIASG